MKSCNINIIVTQDFTEKPRYKQNLKELSDQSSRYSRNILLSGGNNLCKQCAKDIGKEEILGEWSTQEGHKVREIIEGQIPYSLVGHHSDFGFAMSKIQSVEDFEQSNK